METLNLIKSVVTKYLAQGLQTKLLSLLFNHKLEDLEVPVQLYMQHNQNVLYW